MIITVLYDDVSKKYYQPVTYQNVEDCKRSYLDIVRHIGDVTIARHPENFSVYLVGEFFEDTGLINGSAVSELLFTVSELVRPKLEVIKDVKE